MAAQRRWRERKFEFEHNENETRKIMGWSDPAKKSPEEDKPSKVRLMMRFNFETDKPSPTHNKAVVVEMVPFLARDGKPIKEWQESKVGVVSVSGYKHWTFDALPRDLQIGDLDASPHVNVNPGDTIFTTGKWLVRKDHNIREHSGPIEEPYMPTTKKGKKHSRVIHMDFESGDDLVKVLNEVVEGLSQKTDPNDMLLFNDLTNHVHYVVRELREALKKGFR
ncbi:MAG: hypothetical protein GOV15_03060, partial [Candidatus Diapherotrites archaeon]|nr:hypothetical protein [Candidatus Diapherotrites archaeon]